MYINNHKISSLLLAASSAVGQSVFSNAPDMRICDYSNAIAGAHISNYCKLQSTGTTMNLYSGGTLASRAGYLSFRPTSAGASAYLFFGGGRCLDVRGVSSITLEYKVNSAVSLKLDFGTSNDCVSKSSSDYTAAISVPASTTFRNITFPISFFANMNLQRLLTLGIGNVSPLNVEVHIRKIYFNRNAFVTRARHELFEWTSTGIRRPFRFSSFNAPDLIGRADMGQDGFLDAYEQEDIILSAKQLGGRVVRTYTLRVKSSSDITNGVGGTKAIQGIGVYNETQLVQLDRALQLANKHGVRLIIPFIDNWQWNGGVADFAAFRGKTRDSFFTDTQLIADFKNVLTFLLNRVNTLTGVAYKNDPAVLAWQLGNELCIGELQNWAATNYRQTPPSSWAREMANHIRGIDSNHLIMDGYWSNRANYGGNWDDSLLGIRYLDIMNVHYYGGESSTAVDTEYSRRMAGNANNAFNSGKAAIIDEFGIARRRIMQLVQNAISTTTGAEKYLAGVLMWSIRSQSSRGGALVHNEYAGFVSYQWPGYTQGPRCNVSYGYFSPENYDVVNDMYNSMQTLNNQNAIAAASMYPPCSHNGAILQASVQVINSQSESCIWSFTHSIVGVSTSFRAVNLRIRQPTGAFSNMVQFSFDNIKFVNLNLASMTQTENRPLYAHKVPVLSSGGTTRPIYYRVSGLLKNNQYTKPTTPFPVLVNGVDTAFYNWWQSQAAGTLNNANAPVC